MLAERMMKKIHILFRPLIVIYPPLFLLWLLTMHHEIIMAMGLVLSVITLIYLEGKIK